MIPRPLPFPFRSGLLVLVGALLALLLSACGLGRMATGVVVWSPEGSTVKNGDLVWVWEQSRIRKSYKIQRPEGGEAFEIDQWRILAFAGEGEAQAFQKGFLPLKDTWAVSGKQGLPVRESADANANRVYRLGENEEVKVLAGNGPRVKQGNLEGSWVQILTKDGYSGWVFDYYLTLAEKTEGVARQLKASGPGDQMVQAVLSQDWYPEDMKAMVEQDRINPTLFRADVGLRFVESPSALLLVLPGSDGQDERFELPIGTAQKLDDSTYSFGGAGQVKVQFANSEGTRMTLSFTWQGKTRSIPLAVLDESVGTLVSRELASRQQKLQEILNRGKTLTSPTYGTISLTPEGTFTWEEAGTALPDVTETMGVVRFDWFKDKRLFGEFRAIRFQFGDEKTGPSGVFLYRFLKDGFQMLPADPADLDAAKQTVVRESRSGLSLFFTFQE